MLPPMPEFPFSAVVGQQQFKTALLLTAVNPSIGGVLVSGPRGCAKSTLARALGDIVKASGSGVAKPFVCLPLGATEEMVVGTLNLQQILDKKKVEFLPGILAKANNGILYVDEVNLLADPLVDLLLDVASSGINRVERDGISHAHDSQFVLVGTMNPDEGYLRPQLQDRFGLSVNLDNQYSVDERIEIVKRRETFDRHSTQFVADYVDEQTDLIDSILQAKNKLTSVFFSDALRREIAVNCSTANVDGLRADIVWYKAALAHAALCGRLEVLKEDLAAVEPLVLAHRRQISSPRPPFSNSPDNSDTASSTNNETHNKSVSNREADELSQTAHDTPGDSSNSNSTNREQLNNDSLLKNSLTSDLQATEMYKPPQDAIKDPDSEIGEWGEMIAPVHKTLPTDIADALPSIKFNESFKKMTGNCVEIKRKRRNYYTKNQSEIKSNRINWLSTLLHNQLRWPLEKLYFHNVRRSTQVFHLLLLDMSGSTTALSLIKHIKAIAHNIAEHAYIARDQLLILSFRGNHVTQIINRVCPPLVLTEKLSVIKVGGGTPLKQALQHAKQLLTNMSRCQPNVLPRTYIVTDGRSTQLIPQFLFPGETFWIDVESSLIKRGRGAELAASIGAHYVTLPIRTF